MANEANDIRYTIESRNCLPKLSIEAGNSKLMGDEFSVFVQNPYDMVEPDGPNNEPSFSSQEWFSTLWSFCGTHQHVVNPPSIGAWGPSVTNKLLGEQLNEANLPLEYTTSDPDRIANILDHQPEQIGFAENLGTCHRKYLSSKAQVKRWGKRGANDYGLRAYIGDSDGQLLQLFVGNEIFTLRNDWGQDVASAEHKALCSSIRQSLAPLKLGFYAVAFHKSEGTTRVSTVYRDVPLAWFESQSIRVFDALTQIMERES